MRNVLITRNKRFVGSLIRYFILLGYPKTEIDPLDPNDIWDFPEQSGISIKNGQTISIPISETECCLAVWADTSTGMASGPVYHIDNGSENIQLELITEYSWQKGSRYVLRPARFITT